MLNKIVWAVSGILMFAFAVLAIGKFLGWISYPWGQVLAPLVMAVALQLLNAILTAFFSGGGLIALILIVLVGFGLYYFTNIGRQNVNFNPGADKVEQQFQGR